MFKMQCRNDTFIPCCASESIGVANQLFALLIQTLTTAYCSISPPEMWPMDYGPKAIQRGKYEDVCFRFEKI